MINVLWQLFFDICCFRKRPQDIPGSRELLVFCLLIYFISSFFLAMTNQPPDVALLSGLADTLLIAGLSYLLLIMWRLSPRWLQTVTAFAGTGTIFNLMAVPLSWLLIHLDKGHPLLFLVFLFVICLLVWNIAVMAHILRNALSSSFALGVLFSLLFVWAITSVISGILPPTP